MAHEEHVALLKQGVQLWNSWRHDNQYIQPDLSGATFANTMLSGINLDDAILFGANLTGAMLFDVFIERADLDRAHLSGAVLRESWLRGATLREANLNDADLSDAYIQRADLSNADLTGANLRGADLSGAILHRANLTEAILNHADLTATDLSDTGLLNTSFIAVNLSTVEGLNEVNHFGPSSIGIDTIYLSNADIPESFLRGAGVPETFIEYMRSLVVKPIDFYSVFISYSSHDEELAERLHADLQAARVRCWYAPHDLKPGEVIVSGIDQAIRVHDKVLLLLSEASVSRNWVSHEVQLALTREAREGRAVLFPVRMDDSVMDTASGWAVTLREARHIGDFRQWKQHDTYKQAFQRLLRDLTKTDDRPAAHP